MITGAVLLYRYWYRDKRDGLYREDSVNADSAIDAGEKIVERHGSNVYGAFGIALWGFIDCMLAAILFGVL